MKSFKQYLKRRLKEDAVMTAGDGVAGDVVSGAEPSTGGEVQQGTSAEDVLGKYGKEKGCFGPGDFHLPDPLFKYDRFAGASSYGKKKRKKPIKLAFQNDVVKKELKKIFENWDPKYDDKDRNEFGEHWIKIDDRHNALGQYLEDVCRDCMLDPNDYHAVDAIHFYSLHWLPEGNYYIAHLVGGTNGLNDRKKLAKYFALVKKFASKLLEDHEFIESAWLVDFCNDCCDDVWGLRVGISLVNKDKKPA